MDNLGADIRRQREEKNITIEELSQKTKISIAVLNDIENGKFDRYKGDEAYVKMYLKKISNVLSLDAEFMTQQYVDLTREIQMEEVRQKGEQHEDYNEAVVKKGKKFSFEAPQLTRKPSVYEDHSHVTVIRATIILILVCLVIVVIWFGFYATRSKSNNPEFVPQNQTTVEGDVNTDTGDSQNGTSTNDNVQTTKVEYTRNDRLDFSFKLPEGTEKFTFKMEFGNKSWAKLSVNGQDYNQFKPDIYGPSEDGQPATVELEFNVADFKNLVLKNGYSAGHHYYINGVEIPLTEDDTSYSVTNLKLTLEKE